MVAGIYASFTLPLSHISLLYLYQRVLEYIVLFVISYNVHRSVDEVTHVVSNLPSRSPSENKIAQ